MLNLKKKLDDVEQSQPRILISNTTFKKVKILHSVYRSDDGDKLVMIVRLVKYNMVNGMLSGDIINIKFKKDDITADFDKEDLEIRGAFNHNLTSWNVSMLIELDPL